MYIGMEIDWTSTRTVAATIALMHELLPRDLAMIAADYLNDRRGRDLLARDCMLHRIDIHDDDCNSWDCASGGCGNLTIIFRSSNTINCWHMGFVTVDAIWDFACGETLAEMSACIDSHECRQLAIADARADLRRRIQVAASKN
jgi:hypothetical protein